MERRRILVPRDSDVGPFDEACAAVVIPITDHTFVHLWQSGFIQGVNEEAGTLIDDYESEFLEGPGLDVVERVLNRVAPGQPQLSEFWGELRRALAEAKRRGSGMAFWL